MLHGVLRRLFFEKLQSYRPLAASAVPLQPNRKQVAPRRQEAVTRRQPLEVTAVKHRQDRVAMAARSLQQCKSISKTRTFSVAKVLCSQSFLEEGTMYVHTHTHTHTHMHARTHARTRMRALMVSLIRSSFPRMTAVCYANLRYSDDACVRGGFSWLFEKAEQFKVVLNQTVGACVHTHSYTYAPLCERHNQLYRVYLRR